MPDQTGGNHFTNHPSQLTSEAEHSAKPLNTGPQSTLQVEIWCRPLILALSEASKAVASLERDPLGTAELFESLQVSKVTPLEERIRFATTKLGETQLDALSQTQEQEQAAKREAVESLRALCEVGKCYPAMSDPSQISEAFRTVVRAVDLFTRIKFVTEMAAERPANSDSESSLALPFLT